MLFLQWHDNFHDIRITFFCGTFGLRNEITLKLRFVLFVIVMYSLLRHNYVIYLFDVLAFFKTLEWRYILVRPNYVWKWRDNYLSFLFVIVTYFLLRRNYVIYLFDVVTFFDDVRITLYFGTLELRTEITLKRSIFSYVCL